MKKKSRSIVYVDESGFAHDMPRTHGYSTKGKRCYGVCDWGAKGRTNAIGALIGKSLLSISLFSGNVDTKVFNCWIQYELIPKLPKNSVIVMDNASFYKGEEMKLALEKAGHTLIYLPPYSPDLKPIEHKWAHAKKIRRDKNCNIHDLFQFYASQSFYNALAIPLPKIDYILDLFILIFLS